MVESAPKLLFLPYIAGVTEKIKRGRLIEHKVAVKKCDNKNGIAVYAWKSGHQVEWEPAKVTEVVHNLAHRRIAEALHIYLTPNMTNLDCGLTLNSIWFPFFTLSIYFNPPRIKHYSMPI